MEKLSSVCCSISAGSPSCDALYHTFHTVRPSLHRGDAALGMHTVDVCNCMRVCPYCSGVELHFEFLQVEPLFGLAGVQVVVEVARRVAKAVELPVRSQQDGGGSLLIGHTGVSALPASGWQTKGE